MNDLIESLLYVGIINAVVLIIVGVVYFILDLIDKYQATKEYKIMMEIAKKESDEYVQDLIKNMEFKSTDE